MKNITPDIQGDITTSIDKSIKNDKKSKDKQEKKEKKDKKDKIKKTKQNITLNQNDNIKHNENNENKEINEHNKLEVPEVKKKRQYIKKKDKLKQQQQQEQEKENTNISSDIQPEVNVPKKRGRKPKGGKIITTVKNNNNDYKITTNIILHLKCQLKDLETTHSFMSDVKYEPYIHNIIPYSNDNPLTSQHYHVIDNKNNDENTDKTIEYFNDIEHNTLSNDKNNNDHTTIISSSSKIIQNKLKELSYMLKTNNLSDKKSACFWCTYEFDNPPIYIPKYELNKTYQCYGCFCSPECAVGYLFNEHIDKAVMFERYHLINSIYCKIYDYDCNIKPAPNPFYLLNKFYGNLDIQQYRQLLKSERVLLVIDKPLTRILPEIHEDNNDFIINNKIIPSNNINQEHISMKSTIKKKTKVEMLNKNFGL